MYIGTINFHLKKLLLNGSGSSDSVWRIFVYTFCNIPEFMSCHYSVEVSNDCA